MQTRQRIIGKKLYRKESRRRHESFQKYLIFSSTRPILFFIFYFQKGSTKAASKSKENKYSEIAGHFFFPLLKPYDRNRVYLKIMNEDFLLLGKLVFTLAIVTYSAVNTTVLNNMVKAMLDFICSLRNHNEP